jgi:hypothetical protein
MTITEARQTIVDLVSALNTDLTPNERIALAMADMALKSIDEMDAMLSKLENNERRYQ